MAHVPGEEVKAERYEVQGPRAAGGESELPALVNPRVIAGNFS